MNNYFLKNKSKKYIVQQPKFGSKISVLGTKMGQNGILIYIFLVDKQGKRSKCMSVEKSEEPTEDLFITFGPTPTTTPKYLRRSIRK